MLTGQKTVGEKATAITPGINAVEKRRKENAIRVLLADDHRMFLQGLSAVIESQDDMTVVSVAENGEEAIELALELSPDIMLMDISFSDINGILATEKILEECPSIRIIGLSLHSGREYIHKMMQAGASGYIVKECSIDELLQAIRIVSTGCCYLSPSIAGFLIESYVKMGDGHSSGQLTGREREIIHYIAEGLSTKKIAGLLNLSTKTIESHKRQLKHKLGIFSVAQLTKFAIREGLSTLSP